MKTSFLACICSGAALLLLSHPANAHGGQYRGPGDVIPPGYGGGRAPTPGAPGTPGNPGPVTPGPGTPGAPRPVGPGTGQPMPPGGRPSPVTPGGGIQIEDDLVTWNYWWEFNKDPYLRLRDAIHSTTAVSGGDEFFLGPTRKVTSQDTLTPSEEDRVQVLLPALKKAIDSTEDRDITSSCLVAMAKVGRNHSEFKLRDVFAARLTRGDQEINETAALALGIAAIPEPETLDLLCGLALDEARGRKAVGRGNVNERTRAFACYGLGLLANANSDLALKRKVFDALRKIVAADADDSRDATVAAINAIAVLNPAVAGSVGASGARGDAETAHSDEATALRNEALQCLEAYYLRDLGAGRELLQAHVPPAIAKLLGRDCEDQATVDRYRELFVADLAGRNAGRKNNDIARSCVLALGQLQTPIETESAPGIEVGKLLLDTWKQHKDQQTKYFSVLALGQIGGNWCREQLLKEFDGANMAIERPWVALAMGVYSFHAYETQRAQGQSVAIEVEFGRKLRDSLKSGGKDPLTQSGVAVALGLCRYREAAADLRALLQRSRGKDDLAGYVCIALALMGEDGATADIRDVVATSVRRPELLQQAAIALGKLGDKSVADALQKLLDDGDTSLGKMSAVASALGFIGDRRTIVPLIDLMQNESLTSLSRAFAAVALGGVGDKESLPWNSKLGQNVNYRAAVPTLTDKTSGILDIL